MQFSWDPTPQTPTISAGNHRARRGKTVDNINADVLTRTHINWLCEAQQIPKKEAATEREPAVIIKSSMYYTNKEG